MTAIGLDVGGANLKASDGSRTHCVPFALWKDPDGLVEQLRLLLAKFPERTVLAVTMTGELADCYASRQDGVNRILDAVEEAAGPLPVRVWHTGGEFLQVDEARELWSMVAAANWHVLATWCGRSVPEGHGLLLDMGSTTTDIIPLANGLPAAMGQTDFERLASGELVYAGASRTPVCSLVQEVMLSGRRVALAREVFATMLDVQLLRSEVVENGECCETADGRPATVEHARQRMARMIGLDGDELSIHDFEELAQQVEEALLAVVGAGLNKVLTRMDANPDVVIVSGAGEELAQLVVRNHADCSATQILSLERLLGTAHSHGACAYAAAVLLSERGA